MALALTADQITYLRSNGVAIRTLVDLYLDSGRISVWDGDEQWTFDGTTYAAVADLVSIDAIRMGTDLGAEGVQITVNGTKLQEASPDPLDPGAIFGTVTTENYQQRRMEIRYAFFNAETGALIFLKRRFAGLIETMRQVESIDDDGRAQSLLVVSCESIVRRYGKRIGRTRSHEDQQEIWPGDTFFKFTADSVSSQGAIYWGRNAPGARGGSSVFQRFTGRIVFK